MHKNISNIYYNYKHFITSDEIIALTCDNCMKFFFLKKRFYLFVERGEGRGKEGRKDQCVVASLVALTGDLACNPGMCPDWESN